MFIDHTLPDDGECFPSSLLTLFNVDIRHLSLIFIGVDSLQSYALFHLFLPQIFNQVKPLGKQMLSGTKQINLNYCLKVKWDFIVALLFRLN